ncbi:MAG: hypothetical protein Q9227_008729 [Pyrenula ochraceoflavens]
MTAEKEATEVSVQSPKLDVSSEADEAFTDIDPQIERRILRKIDFRLVPILWFLFLVSFVDRGNIGNAKIAGMVADLKLRGNDYNTAVWVFTLSYVLFAVPANIVFKKLGPKSLSAMIFFWGAWIDDIKPFLLANAISNMAGIGGYNGWRWIFILEGAFTVLVAFISWFIIFPFPEDSKIFTPEEKTVLLARLKADGANVKHDNLRLIDQLADWKIWVSTFIYFAATEVASSIINFQPTILKGLGYTAQGAQVHTIPVYIVAASFSVACAYAAEWLGQRYLFLMIGMTSTIIGSAIEMAQPKAAGVRYFGMFLLTPGPDVIMPLLTVWLAINLGKGYKRNIGLGVLIGFGNCGSFVSSNVFLTKETPKFLTGFSVGMGVTLAATIMMTGMYITLRAANRARDRESQDTRAGFDSSLVEDLGEKHPDFRFAL